MIVIDVNVLFAAFRVEHPHHESARAWLERALQHDEIVVPDTVWVGFIRLATGGAAITPPARLTDAFAFVRAITESDAYRSAGATADLHVFEEVCTASDASGNLVPDAYIAGIARALGCPVASFDRDFRRFDDLDIVVPG